MLILGTRARRSENKNESSEDTTAKSHSDTLREGFSNALSEAVFSDDLDKCISSIAASVRSAFGGDAFVFRRNADVIELVSFSSSDPQNLAALLVKVGLKLDVHSIPVSPGRDKVFDSPYSELEDSFQLLGDMTTTAACRKIQRDLKFRWIVTAATKTGSEQLALIVLLQDKSFDIKAKLLQFSDILKSAVYVTDLKRRLTELETASKESVNKDRSEPGEVEPGRSVLIDEVQLPAAILDDKGNIVEMNEEWKKLVGERAQLSGELGTSILDEAGSHYFEEMITASDSPDKSTIPVKISGQNFSLWLAARKDPDGKRVSWLTLLSGSAVNLDRQRELEQTIGSLRTELGLAQRLASEGSKDARDIVSNATVPALGISGNAVKFTSEKCPEVFDVHEGETLDEFIDTNGISKFSGTDPTFEVTDSRGRTFFVTQWNTSSYRFCAFIDMSAQEKLRRDFKRLEADRGKLFNSFLPTAIIKDEKLVDWNNAFSSQFKDFLFKSSQNTAGNQFDSFLGYLGENAEDFKLELHSSGFVIRTCHTTAGQRSFDVNAVASDDSVFLFVRDNTTSQAAETELHETREVLSGIVELLRDDPVIVVREGRVYFASSTAVDHLAISAGQPFLASELQRSLRIKDFGETFLFKGNSHKIEVIDHGALTIYRIKTVEEQPVEPMVIPAPEIKPLPEGESHPDAELERKALHQLVLADAYDAVLHSLGNMVKSRVSEYTARILAVGIIQPARATSEIHYMTVSSGKVESAAAVNFTIDDSGAIKDDGIILADKIPGTSFMKVISELEPKLVIQSSAGGGVVGFASVAITDSGASPQHRSELTGLLKIASSVASGIHLRASAERKFAEGSRITRAVVGLSGIEAGTFADVLKRTVDLLKQVLGCDSVGAYSGNGTSMTSMAIHGDLPSILPLQSTRFGSYVPVADLGSDQIKSVSGLYFALRSRSGKIGLVFKILDAPPAASELGAIASISIDLLEARMSAENQSNAALQYSEKLKLTNDFLKKLVNSTTTENVVRTLQESLPHDGADPTVTIVEETSEEHGKPGEVLERQIEDRKVYEVNLGSGIGAMVVECQRDEQTRTMVSLAADRIRSLGASYQAPKI